VTFSTSGFGRIDTTTIALKNITQPSPPSELECKLPQVIATGSPYALTMFSGASKVAPFVRYNFASFYFSGREEDIIEPLKLKTVTTGANLRIFKREDDGVYYGLQQVKNLRAASSLQLYLDRSTSKDVAKSRPMQFVSNCSDSKFMDQYPQKQVDISLALLFEILDALKGYGEDVGLVGGWALCFLLKQFSDADEQEHVGSLDADLALNFRHIPEEAYETILETIQRMGYSQRTNAAGKPIPASFAPRSRAERRRARRQPCRWPPHRTRVPAPAAAWSCRLAAAR
jgi:hypothetical protein